MLIRYRWWQFCLQNSVSKTDKKVDRVAMPFVFRVEIRSFFQYFLSDLIQAVALPAFHAPLTPFHVTIQCVISHGYEACPGLLFHMAPLTR